MLKTIPFYQSLLGQGTTTEILLYGLIEVLSYEKGFCYASNKYLAEELGISIGTLANTLSNISKKGWVQVQFNDENQREAIIPQLWGDSLNNEGGVNLKMNKYKKKDIIDKYNSNNKDKSLLLEGESPKSEVVEKSSYGNEEINTILEDFEILFGYKAKNDSYNRRAIYNMLRAKDKGKVWLRNMMWLWSESRNDPYSKRISDFVDLQKNYMSLMEWGQRKSINEKNGEFKWNLNELD